MIDVITRKQIDEGKSYKCGPFSLEAVLRYYGSEKTADDIWEKSAVKRTINDQMATSTIKLVQFANNEGLCATMYKAKDIAASLDVLDRVGATAMLVVAFRHPGDIIGHSIVFRGRVEGGYEFSDPGREMGDFRVMSAQEITDFAAETGVEVTGNIFVTFAREAATRVCPHCGKEFPVALADELGDTVYGPICSHCDNGDWE